MQDVLNKLYVQKKVCFKGVMFNESSLAMTELNQYGVLLEKTGSSVSLSLRQDAIHFLLRTLEKDYLGYQEDFNYWISQVEEMKKYAAFDEHIRFINKNNNVPSLSEMESVFYDLDKDVEIDILVKMDSEQVDFNSN